MARRNVPAWLPAVSLLLCVLGLAVSGYLTYEHYTASATLSCPDTGAINCLKVTTSSYSTIVGVPVALLGLLYFLAATPLCLPAAWRSPLRVLHWLRMGGSLLGVMLVVYLVWVELFRIDAICLWCSAVHVVAVALFSVICVGTAIISDTSANETA